MTAPEILKIVVTVGTVQLVCNLLSNFLVFQKEHYKRALSAVTRTKTKLDKEQASAGATAVAPAADAAASSSKRGGKIADKVAKRLKRAEDDYSDAVGTVARIHVVPNIMTSVVFIILLRVLGAELKGNVVGVLPFAPFRLLQKVTARGLTFGSGDAVSFESTNEFVTDTSQACSFMFVYFLSTFSVKFYVNKLFGTTPPRGSEGFGAFLQSPQGQKFAQAIGVDPNDLKME